MPRSPATMAVVKLWPGRTWTWWREGSETWSWEQQRQDCHRDVPWPGQGNEMNAHCGPGHSIPTWTRNKPKDYSSTCIRPVPGQTYGLLFFFQAHRVVEARSSDIDECNDELEPEEDVFTATGTRSTRRGFLAHGGGGGSTVFVHRCWIYRGSSAGQQGRGRDRRIASAASGWETVEVIKPGFSRSTKTRTWFVWRDYTFAMLCRNVVIYLYFCSP